MIATVKEYTVVFSCLILMWMICNVTPTGFLEIAEVIFAL